MTGEALRCVECGEPCAGPGYDRCQQHMDWEALEAIDGVIDYVEERKDAEKAEMLAVLSKIWLTIMRESRL